MSSLVRKSSHFAPKIKKRPIRKPPVSATPPSTQEPGPAEPTQDTASTQTNPVEDKGTRPVVQAELSPPPTQEAESSDTAKTILEPLNEAKDLPVEDDLDPKEKVDLDPREEVDHDPIIEDPNQDDDEEDYGDNDIFKKPFMTEEKQRRRSSVVASHRRLSGLGNLRRGLVSATPGPPDSDQETASPINIAVPVTKPSKKRRQSSSSRASKIHRPSVGAAPEVLLREEPEEEEENTSPAPEVVKKIKIPSKVIFTTDVTVGICPVTNKLRKFRTSESVIGYDDLPVAPPDLVTTVTDIRQIPKSIDISDEELFSKVNVLVDDLSLAELCKPMIRIGTTTENFSKARQALVKIAAKRDERRSARVMAREKKIPYEKALKMIQGDITQDDGPQKLDLLGLPEDEEATGTAVQLSLVGGKLQVDQESTLLTRNPTTRNNNREVEIENPFENPITSRSYTKMTHTDAWTQDEVIQLYKALSTWGTNFTFISQLFPYRTRRQVKRKFAAEEKKNPQLVELALKRKLPLNIEDYTNALPKGESLKTLEDFHKEMEKVQNEHQKLMEEIQVGRERAIKEDLEKKDKIVRGMGMTRREVKQNLRRTEEVVGSVDDIKRPLLDT